MQTNHSIYFNNATNMKDVNSENIDLIITSPPYPMIEMWDEQFSLANPEIKTHIKNGNGIKAFNLMHKELDPVWDESYRVLKNGGFICLNIGDATRTIDGEFGLYPNHARILTYLVKIGFTPLPCILWRKQTNAPNKFMGSGTLPSGAYVTLEHEYILILRKGEKRIFNNDEQKMLRRESTIFWEERNNWYSDVWMDIKGTVQGINDKEARKRSAAFPFELAYRLVNMYSVKGDVVLDPFLGTGTSMAACMATARNSIGFEIDKTLQKINTDSFVNIVDIANKQIELRINRHLSFISDRLGDNKPFKYKSINYKFPVVTSSEQYILFSELKSIKTHDMNRFTVEYENEASDRFLSHDILNNLSGSDTVKSSVNNKHQKQHGLQLSII